MSLGRSRFDFMLTRRGSADALLEIKSATLVVDGVARSPDAARDASRSVSSRRTLAPAAAAMVLFVVQREDTRVVHRRRAGEGALADLYNADRS